LAAILPAGKFNVATTGRSVTGGWVGVWPEGHAARYVSVAGGPYRYAQRVCLPVDGTLQTLDGIVKLRVPLAARLGPPKAPAAPRVSAIRHGVSVYNVSAPPIQPA